MHIKCVYSCFCCNSIVNKIGDAGAISLSESLIINTALTQLDLSGQFHNAEFFHKQLIHFKQTGNSISDAGITSLNDALKENTSLTDLILEH